MPRVLIAGLALLLALTGCGVEEDDPVISAPTGSTPGSTSVPGAPEPSGTSGSSTGSAPAPAGGTLVALVGTKDSPEAFEISLTDEAGNRVETLPAGTYTIRVTDESRIHNFALKGDGVEMATSVSKKESPTWTVTLKPGDYTYICDPHPRMSGSFLVT